MGDTPREVPCLAITASGDEQEGPNLIIAARFFSVSLPLRSLPYCYAHITSAADRYVRYVKLGLKAVGVATGKTRRILVSSQHYPTTKQLS